MLAHGGRSPCPSVRRDAGAVAVVGWISAHRRSNDGGARRGCRHRRQHLVLGEPRARLGLDEHRSTSGRSRSRRRRSSQQPPGGKGIVRPGLLARAEAQAVGERPARPTRPRRHLRRAAGAPRIGPSWMPHARTCAAGPASEAADARAPRRRARTAVGDDLRVRGRDGGVVSAPRRGSRWSAGARVIGLARRPAPLMRSSSGPGRRRRTRADDGGDRRDTRDAPQRGPSGRWAGGAGARGRRPRGRRSRRWRWVIGRMAERGPAELRLVGEAPSRSVQKSAGGQARAALRPSGAPPRPGDPARPEGADGVGGFASAGRPGRCGPGVALIRAPRR